MFVPFFSPSSRRQFQLHTIALQFANLFTRTTRSGLLLHPMHTTLADGPTPVGYFMLMAVNNPKTTDLAFPAVTSLSLRGPTDLIVYGSDRIQCTDLIVYGSDRGPTDLIVYGSDRGPTDLIVYGSDRRPTDLVVWYDVSTFEIPDWMRFPIVDEPKCMIGEKHHCTPGASKLLCPPVGHRMMRRFLRFLSWSVETIKATTAVICAMVSETVASFPDIIDTTAVSVSSKVTNPPAASSAAVHYLRATSPSVVWAHIKLATAALWSDFVAWYAANRRDILFVLAAFLAYSSVLGATWIFILKGAGVNTLQGVHPNRLDNGLQGSEGTSASASSSSSSSCGPITPSSSDPSASLPVVSPCGPSCAQVPLTEVSPPKPEVTGPPLSPSQVSSAFHNKGKKHNTARKLRAASGKVAPPPPSIMKLNKRRKEHQKKKEDDLD